MIKLCTTKKWIVPWCLRNKYGAADFDMLRMATHNNVMIFSDIINTTFVKLFVKFQLHISNGTKVMNLRRMMAQTGLGARSHYTHLM